MDATAFVFAGGGSLGAVQVGMLKALDRFGIKADCTIGSSVGAINAAYFAANPTTQGIEKLEKIWRSLRRDSVFPISSFNVLFRLMKRRNSLVESTALRRLIQQHLPGALIENGEIPCHIVASDMLDGLETVISTGPVVDALLASAAIPGIFPPIRIGERYLIDGGVANNTPVSVAVDLKISKMFVLPTGYTCAHKEPPRGIIGIALHALNQVIIRQLIVDLERFRNVVQIHVVPPLCPLAVSTYDFSRAGEMIDRAEAVTSNWLTGGGLDHFEIPHELPLHKHSN